MFWHPMFLPMVMMSIMLGGCATTQAPPPAEPAPPIEPAPKVVKAHRAAKPAAAKPVAAKPVQAAPEQPKAEQPDPEKKPLGVFLQRFHDTVDALRPHKQEP